jgi:hypothetical protein
MSRTARTGQVVLAFIGALSTLIAVSVYAPMDEPFESDAQALIATFGAGFGILVVVLATVGLASGERWAWLALWIVPVFLISHVVLLGTVVPDAVLALLAVAALWLTRPTQPAGADVTPVSSSDSSHSRAATSRS